MAGECCLGGAAGNGSRRADWFNHCWTGDPPYRDDTIAFVKQHLKQRKTLLSVIGSSSELHNAQSMIENFDPVAVLSLVEQKP